MQKRIIWAVLTVLLPACNAQNINGSEDALKICVEDARAAFDAQSPKRFGPQATITALRPADLEKIEQESLKEISRCGNCPQKPFGFMNETWNRFKKSILESDCVVFFRSNPSSWEGLYGIEGYAIIRKREIVKLIETVVN